MLNTKFSLGLFESMVDRSFETFSDLFWKILIFTKILCQLSAQPNLGKSFIQPEEKVLYSSKIDITCFPCTKISDQLPWLNLKRTTFPYVTYHVTSPFPQTDFIIQVWRFMSSLTLHSRVSLHWRVLRTISGTVGVQPKPILLKLWSNDCSSFADIPSVHIDELRLCL